MISVTVLNYQRMQASVIDVGGIMHSNRSPGRCIRCEAITRSYIGVKVKGKVLCKHCAGAQGYTDEPMEEAIGDGPV